jgi:hypothetical protein
VNAPRERKSVFSEDADDAALDLYFGGGQDDGLHLRVGGLETDFSAGFAVEALEGGLFAADQGDDDFAGIRDLSLLDDDVVAVEDVVVAHGIALDLKDEAVLATGEVAEGDGFAVFDGFERAAGGDPAGEGQLDDVALENLFTDGPWELRDFDGTALIVAAADEALALESGEMFVDGGERSEFQGLGDFFKAGRVAVLVRKMDEGIEDFLLPLGERHASPFWLPANGMMVGEDKAKSQGGVCDCYCWLKR